jgi:hypothetical protein
MEFLTLFLRGLSGLPAIVEEVEKLHGPATGEQKRKAAIDLVGTAINLAEAISTKQIIDAGQFTAALGVIVDGVVACLNASIWHKA